MEPEESIHTEAMLLPNYVNRTLPTEEEQQVATHLKTCVTCQQELQEVTAMQAAIKNSIAQRPGPSPAAFSTLMRRIEQEKQVQTQRIPQPIAPSWWETVESAFRSLFEVQWVPALASVLIVGQTFLLLSLMGTPGGQHHQETGPIIERGIPQAPPQGSVLKVRVGFQAHAQEQHIREFLQTIQARIIDGPSADGTYTLAIAQQGTMTLNTFLAELRQQTNLVQRAAPLNP
ncbi:MAG: zf-HC2 domain-containing protein [Nitrospirota bacterium]|nr:zf-HC2 domain-containing protein [Nitrospirota bacterium]MDH5586592.1 zf-HC2 domain-containing protein [Nitrospirota bacterium]MDH5774812.1 zf-HC2 domain-containing protein [Nitrospirota bacterium]